MAKLFIITGPAGVGKTTVSNALAKSLDKCAILEGDEIYHHVRSGAVKPWLEGNHLDLMWKNMICLAQNYLNEGIDVILNYIIQKDRLEQIIKALATFEIHFVILMASKENIVIRDELRPEDEQVHRVDVHLKNFKESYTDYKYYLNTDDKTVEEEIDEILSGKFLIQEAVDKNHISGLQKMYFDMIESGQKTIEIRLNDEKRQNVNIGDYYAFGLEPERYKWIRKKIKNKYIFKDFSEACNKIDPAKAGYLNRDEMKLVYNAIYPKEKQEMYGVVAFELED